MGLRVGEYGRQVNTPAGHVAADWVGFLRCGNLLALELEVETDSCKAHNTALWASLRTRNRG